MAGSCMQGWGGPAQPYPEPQRPTWAEERESTPLLESRVPGASRADPAHTAS